MNQVLQTQANLTTADSAFLANIQSSPDYRSVSIVQTADIMQTQTDGNLNFLLPGFSDTIKTEATVVDFESSSKYSWGGKVTNYHGNVAFIKDDGVIFGHIQVDTFVFEIRPINTTYSYLVELDPAESVYTCVSTDATPVTITPCVDVAYNTCPATVSVLLLVTQAGQNFLNSIVPPQWQKVFLMFGGVYTNIAFYNSDIPNKAVRIMIDPEIFSFNHDMNNNFDEDLMTLATTADAKRDQFQADAVFLITERNYKTPQGGTIGGVVQAIGAEYPDAYGIIRSKFYGTPYVFSHELGHILGCRHNIESGDNTPDCHHAHTEYFGDDPSDEVLTNVYKTITSIVGANPILPLLNVPHTTSLNYSNPTIFYTPPNLNPTGTNEQNNAIIIRNRLCYTADFWQTEETQIAILQDPTPCLRLFSASVSGPSSAAPYTYQWRWNLTGNFITDPYVTLGNQQTVDVSGIPHCKFFLMLIVSTSNGVILTRQRKVNFCECPIHNPNGGGGWQPMLGQTSFSTSTFDAFPNPASDGSLSVIIPASARERIGRLSLVNSNGTLLFSEEILTEKAGQRLEISTIGFPSGFYSVQYLTEGGKTEKKLVIINRQ